jgi:hypothetical protein
MYGKHFYRQHKKPPLAKAVYSLAHESMAHLKHDYKDPSLMATEFHEARELLKELDNRNADDTSTVRVPASLVRAARDFNEKASEIAKSKLKWVNKKREAHAGKPRPRRVRKDGKEHVSTAPTIESMTRSLPSIKKLEEGEHDVKVVKGYLHKLIKKIPLLYYHMIHYGTHEPRSGAGVTTRERSAHESRFYKEYHSIQKALRKAKHGAHGAQGGHTHHKGKTGGPGPTGGKRHGTSMSRRKRAPPS